MNAPATLPVPSGPTPRDRWSQRQDGWTPDRRRNFLAALAEGHTVGDACKLVGLSPASAYALRHRADGADFALGWQAALLVGRAVIADTLLSRAIHGQVDTCTRADGHQITRHRYDNRLALSLLSRLDRLAEAEAGTVNDHAARIVAQDFHAFLDMVERGEGPARAALFLTRRDATGTGHDPDLAAVAALARADLYLRTGAGTATELDIADLDPAQRSGWSAEQWARAEAAGLVALAPAPSPAPGESGGADDNALSSQLHQLDDGDFDDREPAEPVWWDEQEREFRTRFPPPDDFAGDESGDYGDEDYERSLTFAEEEAFLAPWRVEVERRRVIESAERDLLFATAASDGMTDAAAKPEEQAAATDERHGDDGHRIDRAGYSGGDAGPA